MPIKKKKPSAAETDQPSTVSAETARPNFSPAAPPLVPSMPSEYAFIAHFFQPHYTELTF